MRQIFVVYETNAWHELNKRECAGVFTSKWAAVNAIVKNHRIELDEFFDEDEIEKTSKRVLEASEAQTPQGAGTCLPDARL